MARKRDYAAEYRRRQERARQLGYSGYYERRTRAKPGAAKPGKEELARLRGHRSAADLEALLRAGRVEQLATFRTLTKSGKTETTALATLDDGRTIEFTLRGPQAKKIGELVDEMGTDAPQLFETKPKKTGDEEDLDEVDEEVDFDEPFPWEEAA